MDDWKKYPNSKHRTYTRYSMRRGASDEQVINGLMNPQRQLTRRQAIYEVKRERALRAVRPLRQLFGR